MSLILNGTTGLFGNVTGGDISGNFTGGNSSATTALATGSTTARSLANRFADVVNVLDFGADPTGVVPSTTAIQNAIDIITVKGGALFFPQGIYKVSQIVLKSYVTLLGCRQENGWARLSTYDKGSVIRSLDNSGVSPITLSQDCKNWGLNNLIVDAGTQTNPGVHCLEFFKTATGNDSFGGLIDNCKFVNSTGWGALLNRCRPLDIRDSFFMNGIGMIDCFDVNINGCSIDGTNNEHPTVLWDSCVACQAIGNFIWRREDPDEPNNQIKQIAIVDTTNDWITITDDSKFYNNQPVALETTGTFPQMDGVSTSLIACGTQSFLVQKLGSNRIRLWRKNTNTVNGFSVAFDTVGTGTLYLTSGAKDIFCIYEGSDQKIASNRIAGSPAGAFRLVRSRMVSYENNDSYSLNFDNVTNQNAITIIGSDNNIISNSFCGDLRKNVIVTNLLQNAVSISDDSSSSPIKVSENNLFSNNNYNGATIYVNDTSTSTYEKRNIISGWDGQDGITTKRIESPTFRSQPKNLYYSALATTVSVVNGANTNISWSPIALGDPLNIGSGTTLGFTNIKNSLISVTGTIGFSNRPAGIYSVLVYVFISGYQKRIYFEQQASITTPNIIVPFQFEYIPDVDGDIKIVVFQNSGSTLTIDTSVEYTNLSIVKLCDVIEY